MSQDAPIDLKHYARMLWRRRGGIILSAVTVLCGSLIGLQFVPAEYHSTVTLRMEERQRLASELEKFIGGSRGGGGGYRVDEARMDEMAARITSRPFLEKVARLLKMNEDPKVLEHARNDLRLYPDATVDELAIRRVVKKLKTQISFANTGMGNYKIILADSDPDHARLLARWISELFVDYSVQNSLEELRTAHEFGAEQERIYEERLRQSELELEHYKQAAIQTSLEQGFVRERNVSRAEALYVQVLDEADLARLRQLPLERSITEAGVVDAADVIFSDPQVMTQVRANRTELRESATDIARATESRRSAEWPPGESYLVVRRGLFRLIEQRTREIHGAKGSETRDLIERYVFATIDFEAHSDIATYLGQAISDFKLKAQASPRDEIELSRLEDTVGTNRTLLGSFRAQLIASDITQAMELTKLGMRVEILDPPQVPLQPAKPDKAKILIAALLFGPMLGVAIAFVSEIVDPTLRTLADFQRVFNGPVLGTAPLLGSVESGKRGFKRHWVAASITLLLVLTVLFFLTRSALIPDLTNVSPSIQVVDPGSVISS